MSETTILESYKNSSPKTPEQVAAMRTESRRKDAKYWTAIGLSVLTAAGVAAYEVFSSPKTQQITEVVQPYDTPTILVQRGEKKLKRNLEDPSIASFVSEEAWKIQQAHPVIKAGDRVKVDVR